MSPREDNLKKKANGQNGNTQKNGDVTKDYQNQDQNQENEAAPAENGSQHVTVSAGCNYNLRRSTLDRPKRCIMCHITFSAQKFPEHVKTCAAKERAEKDQSSDDTSDDDSDWC